MDNLGQDMEPIQPLFIYNKQSIINTCCTLIYNSHITWMKHCNLKHPNIARLYQCSICNNNFPSIHSVSVHFINCKNKIRTEKPIYAFKCSWCEFTCPTNIGLGVHSRRNHPSEFEGTKSSIRTKAQWSEEELYILASAEAQLPTGTRFVNQALHAKFPDRSIESIKGQRNKSSKYSNILKVIKEKLASRDNVRQLPSTPIPVSNVTTLETDGSGPSTPISTRHGRRRRVLPSTPIQTNSDIEPSITNPFIQAIKESYETNDVLKELCEQAFTGELNMEELSEFMDSNFNKPYKSNKKPGNSDTSKYRRTIKLRRYARFQQMYRRNKKNLADMIINEKEESNVFPSEDSIKDTYKNLYESPSPIDNHPIHEFKESTQTFYPVSKLELITNLKELNSSSPGVDNLLKEHLVEMNKDLLLTILNLQLFLGRQIPSLKRNKTLLIPKKNEGLEDASNWRPITLSSMFARLLHKILAKRLANSTSINERQKAFMPVDGCAHNIFILDTLISNARKHHKQLNIIGIDLSKAFDMVSIHSIKRALLRHSIDPGLINYIINAYTDASTTIICGPTKISEVQLLRGVKQGDPLSPILFNLVLDELVDLFPQEIGVRLGNSRVNCLAFADDIVLCSESKTGMKELLLATETFFKERSMQINAKKCFSLCLSTTVKDRAPIVIKDPAFKIDNIFINSTNYDNFFKYLGIKFNPHGKMRPNVETFKTILDRLKKSPLKPYQKITLLRSNVIPKVLHELILGRITKGLLEQYDLLVRNFVRNLIGLPNDIPTSFFYSKIKEGGLGISSFLFLVPRATLRRLNNLSRSNDPVIIELTKEPSLESLKKKCLSILGIEDINEALRSSLADKFKNDLYQKIDGRPLAEFKNNGKGQLWITGETSIVTGRKFKQMVKLRIGRLPTLENCNRGRDTDKRCRKCQRVNESLQHIVQNCHFTHFDRMARHDSICRFIKEKCIAAKHTVLWEPVFQLTNRKLKPDLLVITPDAINVIDISIVTENMTFRHSQQPSTLQGAWLYKREYYESEELSRKIESQLGEKQIWYGSIIISLRGIWCSKNDETLKRLGIPLGSRNTIVARCMEHTIKIYNKFMRQT